MEIYDVVMKLIGPVRPVGETHADDARFENLKKLTDLADQLITEIDSIAYDFKDCHQASLKAASNHCSQFLDSLGIEK